MQTEHYGYHSPETAPDRRLFASLLRGMRGLCPNCGTGRLFERGLKTHDACHSCGEPLHHHRADDLPAYLNIFIVGHLVVGLTVVAMDFKILGMWSLMFLAIVLALLLAFLLMRPLKGMVVGSQWALRMHGFGGHDE